MSGSAPVVSYATEIRRKALHLGALVIPVGIAWAGRPLSVAVLVPLGFLAVGLDWLRQRNATAERWLNGAFGGLMRPQERPPPGAPIVLNGATWMMVGAALCAALFEPAVAAVALAMQMIADAAAALVGRRFGWNRWPRSSKTVEGSVAFAVAAFAVGGAAIWGLGADIRPLGMMVAAILAAAAEALPIPVDDNLRVPLVAGATMMLAG